MQPTLIHPLNDTLLTLEKAGGKGASLSRLVQLRFPVPPGFVITTDGYRQFVQANGLDDVIESAIRDIPAGEPSQLEMASVSIRGAFLLGRLPTEMKKDIITAYRELRSKIGSGLSDVSGAVPSPSSVAVRSSATMEDLPDVSFAGQHETFLNVVDEEQLLHATIQCWSSLWTARAIGYRLRNKISSQDVALAVVVQGMVNSEVSGVLFTANPLTGLLSETVINATFGLGEALVSGQVEPDHYVVDTPSGRVKEFTLGTKAISTRFIAGGGVESIQEEASQRQTLSDQQIHQLSTTGMKIQEAYGSPQDIEWAYSGSKLFILQSRPITSLFPVPRISFDPLILWFSFGAFQGVVGPMTPLGQEAIQRVVLGVGKKVGANIQYENQDIFVSSGERIWIKVSDLIRHPIAFHVLHGMLGIGEPGTGRILRQISTDPHLGAGKGRLRFTTLRRFVGFILPAIVDLPLSITNPERARDRFDARLEEYLHQVRIPGGANRFQKLANIVSFMGSQGGLADALAFLLPRFMPLMAPSLAFLSLMERLLPQEYKQNGPSMAVLDVIRALPRNVTTEMDLALWETAKAIQADKTSADSFTQSDAAELASHYLQGSLPTAAQAAIRRFLDRYGMRGIGEIDLGQPRWREDPAQVLRTLQSYLQIEPEVAPDLQFTKNAQAAGEAIQKMAQAVRRQRGGWIKARILRGAARRVRLLLGARESPKFLAIRAMSIVRSALLESGQEFTAAGTIDRADDLFFLHVNELVALSRREERDWRCLISERRQKFARELLRRQVPRILVSDGRAFYEGLGVETDTDATITGSPVSPGVIEGIVHVVLNPNDARLAPGEILVCPGTDPAWTPLFLTASGLVMEVGGMMTHGSVVAREYGIPAVVGVHQATQRLKDGQRIRVDGTRGKIDLLEKVDMG